MKILVVHNSYQRQGGEDRVVDLETRMLRAAGHAVRVEIVSNDQIHTFADKVRTFAMAPYDQARADWIARLAAEIEPDILHVHNFFPLITPAAHEAAHALGIPVVQTLHNYRLLCANGLFLRDGEICEKCLDASRLWAVAHKCYRGSMAGSLAAVRTQNRAFRHRTWDKVDRFIALTEFSRKLLVRGGLPAERIAVKPNWVPDHRTTRRRTGNALFVGRLSPEKGVDMLLDAWRNLPDLPLTIAGDGPDFLRLQRVSPPNVTFTGHLGTSEVTELMADAGFLLMPSRWYETSGMVGIEAFAAGLPVVASRLGAMAELVTDGYNGLLFEPNNTSELVSCVRRLVDDPHLVERLGAGAKATFEEKYTEKANLALLEQIYRQAIAGAQTVSTHSGLI